MTLIPAFQIGVWNAWILMLYLYIHVFVLSQIFKDTMKQRKSSVDIQYAKAEKRINTFRIVTLVLAFAYSIFLPLQLETAWFYTGLPIYILGLTTYTIVMVNFATNPPHELVVRGIYRYSRHPQYLTQFFVFVGVGIVSASWVFLSLVVLMQILDSILVTPEERGCLERYGDSYSEYMNKTPRWIGIPK